MHRRVARENKCFRGLQIIDLRKFAMRLLDTNRPDHLTKKSVNFAGASSDTEFLHNILICSGFGHNCFYAKVRIL
jgi:hypothetical protein